MMIVAEYYLSPGFHQTLSLREGGQFLSIKAFPNTYGSADVVMYVLEDETIGGFVTTKLQCVGTNMSFWPSGPLEYLGSAIVSPQTNDIGETIHVFKEL